MTARPALAVSLYLEGRLAVVVGEGPAAEERAARLAEAGARAVQVRAAGYRAAALAGAALVFVTGAARAEEVARDARRAGALVHVVDRPDLSDLAMPALARRGPVTLAVSTDAVAPALARRLREELERLLAGGGAALDGLVDELARLRDALPPGARRERLGALARRLRIDGRIAIEEEGPP